MKVNFWGAAQTVTGSMHLIEYGDKKLLLDCGLYQGRRKEAFERNRELPFKGSEVDAVVLSHAHIDHSGNLPSLVRSGFKGPIYSTSATRDLAVYLLLDSAKIQEYDVKYVNKKRAKKNQKPFKPLYLQEHAMETIQRFQAQEFETAFEPIPGVEVRFHCAGHMLGAASVEVVFDPNGEQRTSLLFSGDIGRPNVPILKDPQTTEGADYIIMEATYGNRLHPQGGDAKQALLKAARETYDSGGKLIIPAFSIGRTQEIVYRLNLLAEAGELPEMEVFVDSPLAVNATGVFKENVDCYDREMLERIAIEEDQDPLGFEKLHYIRNVKTSIMLNTYDKPCVIISASGMCEGGRILHHLKNNIAKKNTTIMFAGFQAPHTLGRLILDGKHDVIKIYGQPYEVNAKICRLESSSGHADQSELLTWAKDVAAKGNVKKVALVHCEMDSAQPFKKMLEDNGIGPVIIPARGDSMRLDQ